MKVGFLLSGDVRALGDSYNSVWVDVFCTVCPVLALDSGDFWAAVDRDPVAGYGSLSSVAQSVLGACLDKRVQTSDWQARPLSAPQLTYAALDALVLVAVVDRVLGSAHSAHSVFTTVSYGGGAGPPLYADSAYAPLWMSEESYAVCPVAAASSRRLEGRGVGAPKLVAATSRVSEVATPAGPGGVLGEEYFLSELSALGLADRVVRVQHTLSSVEFAKRLGVPVGRLVKSLAFLCGSAPVVVLCRISTRVSTGKLAELLAIKRKAVRLASAAECVDIFGYQPGSFGPIAFRSGTAVKVVASADLPCEGLLYFGAGGECVNFAATLAEVVAISGAVVGAVCDGSGGGLPAAADGSGVGATADGNGSGVVAAAAVDSGLVASRAGQGAKGGAGGLTAAAPVSPAITDAGASVDHVPTGKVAAAAAVQPPDPEAALLASEPTDPLTEALMVYHRRPKFLCGSECGRLARWLRVIGASSGGLHARSRYAPIPVGPGAGLCL